MTPKALFRLASTVSLLCLGVFSPLSMNAQEAPPQEQGKTFPPEVIQKFQEAQELQGRQRFVDALAKIDEIEALAPELPDLYNMRGAIYMSPSLRDFDKAKEQLEKAATLSKNALPSQFNLAELLFVKHDWPASEQAFNKILEANPKLPMVVRHLVLYKKLISEAKQDKLEAAEKTLKENFTFMDDTPAYYFGHAAIEFQKKNQTAAQEWMVKGQGVFKPEALTPYMDSLMEVRWVPNIGLPPAEK